LSHLRSYNIDGDSVHRGRSLSVDPGPPGRPGSSPGRWRDTPTPQFDLVVVGHHQDVILIRDKVSRINPPRGSAGGSGCYWRADRCSCRLIERSMESIINQPLFQAADECRYQLLFS
jgi:hypothetical protein